MSQAGLKDRALQAYYESLFTMHGSPGWQALMEDAALMEADYDRLSGLKTAEEMWFRQGQVDMLRWLKNHAQLVESSYNALVEQQNEIEAVESTGGRAQVVGPEQE